MRLLFVTSGYKKQIEENQAHLQILCLKQNKTL